MIVSKLYSVSMVFVSVCFESSDVESCVSNHLDCLYWVYVPTFVTFWMNVDVHQSKNVIEDTFDINTVDCTVLQINCTIQRESKYVE